MIQQYPPQTTSGGGGGGSAAVPVNSYIIGSSAGPSLIQDGAYTYLKSGVVAVASAYPNASTVVCSYPVSNAPSPYILATWMAGGITTNRIVGVLSNNFVYSDDGGATYTSAGSATNGDSWNKPTKIVRSSIFGVYIAFSETGRWYSVTGATWVTAGASSNAPATAYHMQYAEGNGKGIFVTRLTNTSTPTVYVTSNGSSWTEVTTPTNFQDITYHSPTSSFYALGTDGYIYRSTDGGSTWASFNSSVIFGNWIHSDGAQIYCIAGTTLRTSSNHANSFNTATFYYGASVSASSNSMAKVVVGQNALIYDYASGVLTSFNGTQNAPQFNLGSTNASSSGAGPCVTPSATYLVVGASTAGSRMYTLSNMGVAVDNWKQLDGASGAYNYTTLYKRVA